MSEQRNVILAVVLSLVIMLVFQFVLIPLSPPDSQQQPPLLPAPPVSQSDTRPIISSLPIVHSEECIHINTPSLHGTISLIGGRLDTLTLVQYHATPSQQSPEITLLEPPGGRTPYYVDFGWISTTTSNVDLPSSNTLWSTDSTELGVNKPVTLTWSNKNGVVFKRTFTVDEHYLFQVQQKIENNSDIPLTLAPYQVIHRYGTPLTQGMYILHEGPLGVINGKLHEKSYKDLKNGGKIFREDSNGGWIGITDKYWLVAMIPQQDQKTIMRFLYQGTSNNDVYQVDYIGLSQIIAQAGGTVESIGYVFAGAKEVHLLDYYSRILGIAKFDLAIDFGWFYFLTKPFFHALTLLHGLVGNFGVAILLFTVLIKALLFPLANKSYQAMNRMKKLQPELQRLQERFSGGDRVQFHQEVMALYKRERVNPAAGCLPVLIQIPIFFALYKVLFVTIEMRHAPFFGWILDLSAPDPTSLFNLFGLIAWTPPSILQIGVWPLIMGTTMWLQQKINPQPADPVQARLFTVLPIVFTVMLAQFSAGLVIYWAWNNILSILQQWVITRKTGIRFRKSR